MIAGLIAVAFAKDYSIMFPPKYKSEETKAALDGLINTFCAEISTTCTGSLATGTSSYTVTVDDTASAGFEFGLKDTILNSQYKCIVTEVKSGETTIFTSSDNCFIMDYEVTVSTMAAAMATQDAFDQLAMQSCNKLTTAGNSTAFINSTYSTSGVYTAFISEAVAGSFGEDLSTTLSGSSFKCSISSVKSGETSFYSPPDSCYKPNEYTINVVKGISQITKEFLDSQVESICNSAESQGVNIKLINSTYDENNGIYKTFIGEAESGAFGQGFGQAINGSSYRCAIVSVKDDAETYYTRNDTRCFVTTAYEFGLSVGIPDSFTKVNMDGIISTFISIFGMSDITTFISSTLNATHYTAITKELNIGAGGVATGICSSLDAIVMVAQDFCHFTYIGYNGEHLCYPRISDTCADIAPGINTAYEVEYYGTLSATEIDTTFENAIESIKGATLELVKVVESSYNGNTYKATITEPAAGYFAEQFCYYTSNTSIKCDFGPLKANGRVYCKHPDCPGPEYTLRFLDGGEVVKSEMVVAGSDIVYPELSKAGYLLEWDSSATTMPEHDLNISAVWTPGTEYVKIVVVTTILEKEVYEKIFGNFTGGKVDVLTVVPSESGSEATVTLQFETKEKAIAFVGAIKKSSDIEVKTVKFIDKPPSSFSVFTAPLTFLGMVLF